MDFKLKNAGFSKMQTDVYALSSSIENLSKTIVNLENTMDGLNMLLSGNSFSQIINEFKKLSNEIEITGSQLSLFNKNFDGNLTVSITEYKTSISQILPVISSLFSILSSSISILQVVIKNFDVLRTSFMSLTSSLTARLSLLRNLLPAAFVTLAGSAAILTIGYAAITAQVLLMVGSLKSAEDMFSRLGKVLSGNLSYWDALKLNLKDVTFGIIDLTAKTEIMTDATYGLGNAWIWTKKQIQNALDVNKQKLLTSDEGQAVLFDKFLKGETLSIEELSAVESGLNKLRMETHDPELIAKVNQYSAAVDKQKIKLENLGRTETHVSNVRKQSHNNIISDDKQVSWLNEIIQKQKKLEKDIKYFKDLSQDVNQETFVRLNAYEQLLDKQKELNTLMKTGFNLPSPKTGEEFLKLLPEVKIRERDKSGDADLQRSIEMHKEMAKRMQEIYDGMANGVVGSMGTLFASFVPPQAALTPLEQFMKQIVITFINAVQGLVLAAAAALPAKGITSFGVTMLTDAPLLAAAYSALEIAKGFVGGFAKGTDSLHRSGYALVGEQGPELVYLNKGTKIFNNNDTNKMLNNARANQPSSVNVNNVYIASSLDALSFFRVNYPKYKKFKSLQAV